MTKTEAERRRKALDTSPAARVSPRIANGCICWYEGDTFELVLRLELRDQDGAEVTIAEADTVKVTFYDEQRQTVHEFSFTGISGNRVTLAFTEAVTAKFPKGGYTYDMRHDGGRRVTLIRDNAAYVE